MPIYLTEKGLKLILEDLFPQYEMICDKKVPDSKNGRYRPDFRFPELKIIIEFDGYHHYSQAKRILTDTAKDDDYKSLGYSIFRIPYFVQMNSELLKMIFNKKIKFEQVYENGFIDNKAMLPADYCDLGIKLFKKDLERFDYCKKDIVDSLKRKTEQHGSKELVLPESLFFLLDE